MIGLFEASQGHICIVGFEPLYSNWPLLVSFPLFFSNCFAWFDEQRNRSMQTNIQSGEVLTAPGVTRRMFSIGPRDSPPDRITASSRNSAIFADLQPPLSGQTYGDSYGSAIAGTAIDIEGGVHLAGPLVHC